MCPGCCASRRKECRPLPQSSREVLQLAGSQEEPGEDSAGNPTADQELPGTVTPGNRGPKRPWVSCEKESLPDPLAAGTLRA